jgi:hypothetical protein
MSKNILLLNITKNILYKEIETQNYIHYKKKSYIPHKTPNIIDRNMWEYAYQKQLEDMYNIVQNIIIERYPKKKINWNSHKKWKALKELIFKCSSKHISKLL